MGERYVGQPIMTCLAIAFMAVCLGSGNLLGGPVDQDILEPQRHLDRARAALGAGEAALAITHLKVALELAPVGSEPWVQGHVLAMEHDPGLFARSLLGTNFPVPIALAASTPVQESLARTLPIPPTGHFTELMDPDQKASLRFYLNEKRVQDAIVLMDRYVTEKAFDVNGILLAATLYEHQGALDQARTRYREAKVKGAGLKGVPFYAEFGEFRVLVRQGRTREARKVLDNYNRRAKQYLSEQISNHRYDSAGSTPLFLSLLEGRRHLVEGLNARAVLGFESREFKDGLIHIEEARLLAPGSINVNLNYLRALEGLGYNKSASDGLLRISAALMRLETGLLEKLDQNIEDGVIDLSGPRTHRELLRGVLGNVRIRQALLEEKGPQPELALMKLQEAANLDSKNPEIFFHMGRLQKEDPAALEEALVNLRKAAMLSPTDSPLHGQAQSTIDQVLEAQAKHVLKDRTRHEHLTEHFEATVDTERMHVLERELKRGRDYLRAGKYERARDHFRKMANLDKDVVEIFRYLGFAHQRLRSYQEALAAYDKALEIDANDVYSMSQKATTLLEYKRDDGALKEALELARRAYNENDQDALIVSNLGWIITRMGEVSRGIRMIKQALDLDATNPEIHYLLGMAYYQVDLFGFAASKFEESLKLDPNHVKARVFLGLSLVRQGKIDGATGSLVAALQIVGEDRHLRDRISKLLEIMKSGRSPSPTELADPFIPLSSAQIAQVRQTRSIIDEGLDLIRQGRRREAVTLLEARYQEGQAGVDLAYVLGFLYVAGGEADKADGVFKSMIDVNSQELRAYLALADLAFRKGDLVGFHGLLARTGDLSPNLEFSSFLDGVAQAWTIALDTDPKDGSSAYNLGLVRLYQGRLDDASTRLEPLASQEARLLYGQVKLRLHLRDKRQIDYHQAKAALEKAAYPGLPSIEKFWTLVNRPELAPQEKVEIRKPKFIPSKRFEEDPQLTPEIKQLARKNTLDSVDVAKAGIFNRRWDQIDESRRRRHHQSNLRDARERRIQQDDPRAPPPSGSVTRPPGPDFLDDMGGGIDLGGEDPPELGELEDLDIDALDLAGVQVGEAKVKKESGLQGLALRQLNAANDLVVSGKLIEAEQALRSALNFDPTLAGIYQSLALIGIVQDDMEHAVQVIKMAKQKLSSMEPMRLLVGHIQFKRGQYNEAFDIFTRSESDGAGSPFELAMKSQEPWKQQISVHPDHQPARLQLATLQFLAGDPDAALKTLEPVRDSVDGARLTSEFLVYQAARSGDESLIDRAARILTDSASSRALEGLDDILALKGKMPRVTASAQGEQPGRP